MNSTVEDPASAPFREEGPPGAITDAGTETDEELLRGGGGLSCRDKDKSNQISPTLLQAGGR